MSLSKWVQAQYNDLQKLLSIEEKQFLDLVAKYNNLETIDFIVTRIRNEIESYRDDLRFSDWLKSQSPK